MEARAAEERTQAYAVRRRLEHGLQMIDDMQTHKLPESDDEVDAVAVFLGYDDPAAFRAELLRGWGYACSGLLPGFLADAPHVAIMYRHFQPPPFSGVKLHADRKGAQ